jgi:hypothetical protein
MTIVLAKVICVFYPLADMLRQDDAYPLDGRIHQDDTDGGALTVENDEGVEVFEGEAEAERVSFHPIASRILEDDAMAAHSPSRETRAWTSLKAGKWWQWCSAHQ